MDVTDVAIVSAPPKVGDDEEIEAIVGKGLGLNCDVEQEGIKPTITWLAVFHLFFLIFF